VILLLDPPALLLARSVSRGILIKCAPHLSFIFSFEGPVLVFVPFAKIYLKGPGWCYTLWNRQQLRMWRLDAAAG